MLTMSFIAQSKVKDIELKGHTDSVDQLCWDPNHPDTVATAAADKSIRLWDARSKYHTLSSPVLGRRVLFSIVIALHYCLEWMISICEFVLSYYHIHGNSDVEKSFIYAINLCGSSVINLMLCFT